MPRFDNSRDLERHLKKALDFMVQGTIVQTQKELGSDAVHPVDTGRMRSSWFAAEGTPSREVAPEDTDRPNTDANGLRVDASKTYFLSNSLPYAQAIAVEGKTNQQANVKSKPSNWFHNFQSARIPEIQEEAARQTKQRFDL